MKKSDLFSMAIQNLRNRKTRTRLTVIGVVIGTCAIVIMVSIGIGIDKMITSQYESDSALCKIEVHGINTEKTDGKKIPFDDSAVEYFKGIDNVKLVSPILDVSEYISVNRGKYNNGWGTIKAIDFDSMSDMGYSLVEGSFDNIDKRNTLLFGKSSVSTFSDSQGNQPKFKYDENYEIVESEIDIMKDIFSIAPKINSSNDYNYSGQTVQTGNAKKIKAGGILKTDYSIDYETNYGIYIDLELAKELMRESQKLSNQPMNKFEYSEINVYVDNMQNVKAVKEQLQDNGFYCYSDDEELEYTKKIMMVVQLVLGGIGAISMFVAAFGISNTMVMSVMERTKEIGIMKVLGCDIKDIKAMFLYEAGTIGLLGGTIGIIISYILSISANIVARLVASSLMDIDTEEIKVCVSSIPPWLAIAGILFSILIGVIAGLSPAKRSVNVSALTAIHNE